MIPFRQTALERLNVLPDKPVVILGGGVNGAAILRELALNKVPAVLLEAGDFCRGASGASTRLAHGGLRYLEQRQFSLVREAVEERDLLLTHAPHATLGLAINVPLENIFRGAFGTALNFLGITRRRAPANLITLKAAMLLYEFMSSGNRTLPRHSVRLGHGLLPKGTNPAFRSSMRYHDGRFVRPEGLVLEMLREALSADPYVTAINHVNWIWENGAFAVEDPVSGASCCIAPGMIINATGAWVDHVNGLLGRPSNHVSPVRGAHIVIDHAELHARMNASAFYFDDGAGRMVIACPLDRTVLMGTTEIPCSLPDANRFDRAEVDYLCRAISRLFTDIEIGVQHVIAVTTGARPLKLVTEGDAYAASRDHDIVLDEGSQATDPAILTLIGGKWTTFRSLGEAATELIMSRLGVGRAVSTKRRGYLGTLEERTEWPHTGRDQVLLSRYGAQWKAVTQFCAQAPDHALQHVEHYTRREILWLVEACAAVRLDDLLLRRTTLALDGYANEDSLEELASIQADVLDNDREWVRREVARCLEMPAIRYRTADITFDK